MDGKAALLYRMSRGLYQIKLIGEKKMQLVSLIALAAAQSIGASPKEVSPAVGVPAQERVRLTSEQILQISEQLLYEDIAEVDLDPEMFDVQVDTKRKLKKSDLDDIEFISERSPLKH